FKAVETAPDFIPISEARGFRLVFLVKSITINSDRIVLYFGMAHLDNDTKFELNPIYRERDRNSPIF
ncbi:MULTISPECIES: hypothetical protein, partial [unclassified Microcoleus]|uniref:hypothetical protein n=1 Tax=unclassified Microcoleus TaxID=2642155 RepID=UPI002FD41C1E